MSYDQAKALLNKGVSRPTLFSVRLPSNRVSSTTNDYLDFFCQATAIPEVRVNTVAVPGHEYMGIVREQPTAVMFGKPFSMNIIADSEYRVYNEIREWFNLTALNANQEMAGMRTQRMKYYSSYTSDMQLIKLEQGGLLNTYKEALSVNFYNAYPISIGEVSLDTNTNDTYTVFRVDFTYESYNLQQGSGNNITIPFST